MAIVTMTQALKKLYKAVVGEDTTKNNPTKIVSDLADNYSGGGSSLPDVTASDNGMVLTVVEGEWDKAEGGGAETLILHLVGDSPRRADKTWGEIQEAVENGTYILLQDRSIYASMTDAEFTEDTYYINFTGTTWNFIVGDDPDDYPTEDLD